MYLKSIEIQGFKSFANKILFEFHNGITGIVGPNGSGKSNVGDAVRWVLGEQSAKQLRGASMQDVIFAGTQNRKPLSYAYVAITLDNSDHNLAVDYEEVTVARRVYRSGESEYLLNGRACRLKDVTELFYDTGIGKEGYSIIGQGQIERILSGKPEERRELFDEAAGIVKYKKRKAAAQKKLENEQENLVRVNDILSELERQVGPLEQQAHKARTYLAKKEELKVYDVNLYLMEAEQTKEQMASVQEKYGIADSQLAQAGRAYEKSRSEYERIERELEVMEETLAVLRDGISEANVNRGKLEGERNVLKEQIHAAELTDEHVRDRLAAIGREEEDRQQTKQQREREKETLMQEMAELLVQKQQAQKELGALQAHLRECNEGMEKGKSEIIELLNQKASLKAEQQRFDTMEEQVNIRKAQLTQRLLARKTEESQMDGELASYRGELAQIRETIENLQTEKTQTEEKIHTWKQKYAKESQQLEQSMTGYHRERSRLESLKNIAERYDGYGNSIRRVMEQKENVPGLLGVVSDLIQVEKKFETAIETALGGSIQNIVTRDEETAKQMISYLKKNHYGRATFLPLTSVKGTHFSYEEALGEPGILGLASDLVETEPEYAGIVSQLLGRTVVAAHIEDASALAKKYRYALRIVTLEGECFNPGGSLTGGAFKNSSNLLARNREIEESEQKTAALEQKIKELKMRIADIETAQSLLAEDAEGIREKLQEQYLLQNTAELNVKRAEAQRSERGNVYAGLREENEQLAHQLSEIQGNKEQIAAEIAQMAVREIQIQEENGEFQESFEQTAAQERTCSENVSAILLREEGLRQKTDFLQTDLDRLLTELSRCENERKELLQEAETSHTAVEKKQDGIAEITEELRALDEKQETLENQMKEKTAQKEELSAGYKGFFKEREELSAQMASLDKEVFRLKSQQEKLAEERDARTNVIWEEYALTPHAAEALRQETCTDMSAVKKQIAAVREEIRNLGAVNVNAIEDYKEIAERYEFLKTQHDDLVEAEQTLLGVIEELDEGMRHQFTEKFAEIQREFDIVFQELFGGGKGTLELMEGEDILECGIRIIAQPPGKKLQNMMQMSGGEKALTAISLLFAIQNLKPSPFCLLDEIEAALDDSNVGRFADYLHKLTANTQFIVITHRRGTMAAADRLYGITMQEKGVSVLVSVDLIEHELTK